MKTVHHARNCDNIEQPPFEIRSPLNAFDQLHLFDENIARYQLQCFEMLLEELKKHIASTPYQNF